MIFKQTWYSIFERLAQLGYASAVFQAPDEIKQSYKALFEKSKPLTDEGSISLNNALWIWLTVDIIEWNRISPELVETVKALQCQLPILVGGFLSFGKDPERVYSMFG
jgi:hypothetical protein